MRRCPACAVARRPRDLVQRPWNPRCSTCSPRIGEFGERNSLLVLASRFVSLTPHRISNHFKSLAHSAVALLTPDLAVTLKSRRPLTPTPPTPGRHALLCLYISCIGIAASCLNPSGRRLGPSEPSQAPLETHPTGPAAPRLRLSGMVYGPV